MNEIFIEQLKHGVIALIYQPQTNTYQLLMEILTKAFPDITRCPICKRALNEFRIAEMGQYLYIYATPYRFGHIDYGTKMPSRISIARNLEDFVTKPIKIYTIQDLADTKVALEFPYPSGNSEKVSQLIEVLTKAFPLTADKNRITGLGRFYYGYGKGDKSWQGRDKNYDNLPTQSLELFYIQLNQNNMSKDRTITWPQAQKIISVACPGWKEQLTTEWSKDIALMNNNIRISEDFYKSMRDACTVPQHELFDTIFGPYKKEFTAQDLKFGQCMQINDRLAHNFDGGVIMKTLEGNYILISPPENAKQYTGYKLLETCNFKGFPVLMSTVFKEIPG